MSCPRCNSNDHVFCSEAPDKVFTQEEKEYYEDMVWFEVNMENSRKLPPN